MCLADRQNRRFRIYRLMVAIRSVIRVWVRLNISGPCLGGRRTVKRSRHTFHEFILPFELQHVLDCFFLHSCVLASYFKILFCRVKTGLKRHQQRLIKCLSNNGIWHARGSKHIQQVEYFDLKHRINRCQRCAYAVLFSILLSL
jgi:hypothetical protein